MPFRLGSLEVLSFRSLQRLHSLVDGGDEGTGLAVFTVLRVVSNLVGKSILSQFGPDGLRFFGKLARQLLTLASSINRFLYIPVSLLYIL